MRSKYARRKYYEVRTFPGNRVVSRHITLMNAKGVYPTMAKTEQTKKERSARAKKWWKEYYRRFWIGRGEKAINS